MNLDTILGQIDKARTDLDSIIEEAEQLDNITLENIVAGLNSVEYELDNIQEGITDIQGRLNDVEHLISNINY